MNLEQRIELVTWADKAAVIATRLTGKMVPLTVTLPSVTGDVAGMRESAVTTLRASADALEGGGTCLELTRGRRVLLHTWTAKVLAATVALCNPDADLDTLEAAIDAVPDEWDIDAALRDGNTRAIRTALAGFFRYCAGKLEGATCKST